MAGWVRAGPAWGEVAMSRCCREKRGVGALPRAKPSQPHENQQWALFKKDGSGMAYLLASSLGIHIKPKVVVGNLTFVDSLLGACL